MDSIADRQSIRTVIQTFTELSDGGKHVIYNILVNKLLEDRNLRVPDRPWKMDKYQIERLLSDMEKDRILSKRWYPPNPMTVIIKVSIN